MPQHTVLTVAVISLFAAPAFAGEFEKGCERGATEVLCAGQTDCKAGSIMERSRKGLDTEQSGYEECRDFAKSVLALGVSLEAKRAIKRMQGKIDDLNKELAKDFAFIKVTADFKRLEVEDVWKTARHQDHYNTKDRDRSVITALTMDENSKHFDMTYLNPIKTALYNVAKDDDGKAALKAKVKEVRLGFFSHGHTGWNLELKLVDQVLIIPGVYSLDQTGYATSLQSFLEKKL